jgi:uncharacterized protein GlcG (DUF336 family)
MTNRIGLALGAMLCGAATAHAEPLVVEHQIPMAVALEGAQAAIASCLAGGYRIAVTVADKAGKVRVTLRADGANPHLLEGAERKAYTAAMLRITTAQMSEVIQRSPGANALMSFEHMTSLGGGLPIKVGDEVVGGIGVAGVPVGGAGGAGDEGCARAGLEKIVARLAAP